MRPFSIERALLRAQIRRTRASTKAMSWLFLPSAKRRAPARTLAQLVASAAIVIGLRRREETSMPNPGQPTISPGATGDVVKRVQRALRRTPNLGLTVNGTFDSQTETAVKEFQQGAGLVVDGIVGPLTWNALPDGGPMPTLQQGSTGDVVRSLQTVLTNGAAGQWVTTPQGIDGDFGPHTRASVEAFQSWGGVTVDGVVGDQTWSVSLHAASSTLESAVGLNFVLD